MSKINVQTDTEKMNLVMQALEEMKDQARAVALLRDFNEKSADLKSLLMNKDPNLDHNIWKMECDLANRDLSRVIEKILGSEKS